MISLSAEWAALSKEMYCDKFITELANLLRANNCKNIIECGCGDGNILSGLAKRGLYGLGVDSDTEMIHIANQKNKHKAIKYRCINWLELGTIEERFDAVICRGNSISCVNNWTSYRMQDTQINIRHIKQSLNIFFCLLKPGGLLYIDTTSQKEIELGDYTKELIYPDIEVFAQIKHDWKNRIRTVSGYGHINGCVFDNLTYSYLMKPSELEAILREFKVSKIWQPDLKAEINYDVFCVIK